MSNRMLKLSKLAPWSTAVLSAGAAVSLAVATPASKPAPADDGGRSCRFDGRINSIGAVIKDAGRLYRCTLVLEERGVTRAAWVHVEMTTSIVLE